MFEIAVHVQKSDFKQFHMDILILVQNCQILTGVIPVLNTTSSSNCYLDTIGIGRSFQRWKDPSPMNRTRCENFLMMLITALCGE